MDVEFASKKLEKLSKKSANPQGFSEEVVRAYCRRIQSIRAASDERDLYKVGGARFEKLKGNRSHQRSMRLNDQWRLIVEIKEGSQKNTVVVISVEDYH